MMLAHGTPPRGREQWRALLDSLHAHVRIIADQHRADETLKEALAAIADDLGRLDRHGTPDALVGMGGAVTNLSAVKHGLADYDPTIVQGDLLAREEIDRQIELYRTRTADRRREIVGLQPKRAEVILAGACIVRTVLDKLRREHLTVSDRGLRHGLLVERFGTPSTGSPGDPQPASPRSSEASSRVPSP